MNLSKKLSITFCMFLCFLAQQLDASVRDNIYVGLGVGDSFTHFDLKGENRINSFSVKKKKENNRAFGNAFLGFGYTTCNSFYIAAEVGTYFPERSLKISRPGVVFTNFTFIDRLVVQDFLTGDILLGYRPNECFLVYVRGGASYARIKLHQFENISVGTPIFDAKKNKAGIRGGVGINYALTNNFGIGLDYVYTYYQNLRSFWSDFNMSFSVRPHTHFIAFSVIYSF